MALQKPCHHRNEANEVRIIRKKNIFMLLLILLLEKTIENFGEQ